MRLLIPLVVALIACLIIVYVVRARPRTPEPSAIAGPRAAQIDPAAYRNHLGMARWIEARLGDDLVRSALEPVDDVRARQLLQEFYGEEPR